MIQEHRAWAHLGATRYDPSMDIANAEKDIGEMAEKHGNADPAKWKWGAGTPCADIFEADEAKRKHEDLSAKVAAFRAFRDESCTQSIQSASSDRGTRDRSRNPRTQV